MAETKDRRTEKLKIARRRAAEAAHQFIRDYESNGPEDAEKLSQEMGKFAAFMNAHGYSR